MRPYLRSIIKDFFYPLTRWWFWLIAVIAFPFVCAVIGGHLSIPVLVQ